jgi:hypothetical protein
VVNVPGPRKRLDSALTRSKDRRFAELLATIVVTGCVVGCFLVRLSDYLLAVVCVAAIGFATRLIWKPGLPLGPELKVPSLPNTDG